jgi:hypothetical protein
MRTLVIPDIHQKTTLVDQVLSSESNYDEVVFLGDWFDSFDNPPIVSSFEETCLYLRNLVENHPNKNKFIFLLGNHDLSYIYYNNGKSTEKLPHRDGYFCSGFSDEKARIFRKHFFDEGLDDSYFQKHFKPAHQTQGFTLSHAGIHPNHLLKGENVKGLVEETLPEIWGKFRDLDHPRNKLLSGAGYARYGDVPIGGLIWLDWRVEFEPSELIGRQIVGHTHVKEPSGRHLNTPLESWNIDTEQDYGIISNGTFSTKPIKKTKKYRLSKKTLHITENKWE